jgi:hypothetical protein
MGFVIRMGPAVRKVAGFTSAAGPRASRKKARSSASVSMEKTASFNPSRCASSCARRRFDHASPWGGTTSGMNCM